MPTRTSISGTGAAAAADAIEALLLDTLVASAAGLERPLPRLAAGRAAAGSFPLIADIGTALTPWLAGPAEAGGARRWNPPLLMAAPPSETAGPAATPGGPALPEAGEAAPAFNAAGGSWQLVGAGGGTPRLWRYVLTGQNAAIDAHLETLVLIHGWLGSGVTTAPATPNGFGPAFTAAAQAVAADTRQVLFLDWGEQAKDPNPAGVAPYNAAGRIKSVASWARDPLLPLVGQGRTLTLAGFSLGSYVAAQTAIQLGSGSSLRVVALDPGATGLQGGYDLDNSNGTADPVPNLSGAAPAGSLAFVVADTNLTIGLAGDNGYAATAQRSFLVRGFASGTSSADAHRAVPGLYADLARYLPISGALSERILGGFRANQYSNSGSRSGTLRHEGLATVRNGQGALARIEGFTSAGAAQTVHFLDSQDSSTPAGSTSVRDTIVALRNVQLAATASVETVVLGGDSALGARGNAAVQELIGNSAANRLEGGGALDLLTGGAAGDTFVYDALTDARVGGSSSLRSFERITDLDADWDSIDAPGSTLRSIADLRTLSLQALSDAGLGSLLTTQRFLAGGAALFRSGTDANTRLFLGLNDSIAGFDPLRDAIVEITGAQGNLLALQVS